MSLHECECGKSTCIWYAPPASPMTPPSSQPAQPEQTAEERPVIRALRELAETACQCDDTDSIHFHRSDGLPILTRLVLASKVQALEEAARKGCSQCYIEPEARLGWPGWWHHIEGNLWSTCVSGHVWDLLSLLRPEGAQP